MKKPIEPVYILFGARICQIRDALGLTQDELGKKTALNRSSIANIESGKQRVLLADVDRFAKALGISQKNLLKGIWL